MKKAKWLTVSAGIALGALSAMPSQARDFVYGSWRSAKSTSNTVTMKQYLEKIRKDTGGAISFKLLAGGQVATAKGTVDAVKNGTIDAGVAIAPYTPEALPASNMLFNTNTLGNDPVAASGALVEVVLLHCPECLAEYRKNDAVSFAGNAVPPYMLMCTKPVKTVADLKGLKVRASAGGIDIMKIAGATPVAMTVPEGVEAMQRGTVTCSWSVLNWLVNFGYIDVTKYVLDYPLGMAGPVMPFFLNRKVWQGLTPAQRKVLVDDTPFLIATETFDSAIAETDAAIAKAKQRGIEFFAGGSDFDAVMEQHDKVQRVANAKVAADHGVKDPQAILAALDAAMVKWRKLSQGIGHDKAKFIETLKREVYDKLDPEKL
jgi:TRAP-type C4-dicarboxylate transport system substrate-binding protein